jgi:HD-GYP domain-containing protein (c-di-GMP phosphodiesterase class II)
MDNAQDHDYLEELINEQHVSDPHMNEVTYVEMCHGILVSNLARALAEELGESLIFCNKIEIAGVLHDLGKLRVAKYLDSDGKGRLAIERRQYVRMHPLHSFEALKKAHYPRDIAEAVYYHHENYDGSGYPDNLKGDDIPWMARILRTCDVYTALTNDRSYRRAFDGTAAIEIMIDEVENYDMKIFLAFQRLFHSARFLEMDQLNTILTASQKEHLKLFAREMKELSQ